MFGFKYSNPFALNNEVAANQLVLMIVRTKDFMSLFALLHDVVNSC
jgi:hypothetical protein